MLGWEVRIVGARLKQRRGQQDVYMKCNQGVIRKKQHCGQHDVYKHYYTRGDEEECREGTIPWQKLPLKGSICVLTTFLAERCCWCYDIEQNYWATWGWIMIFLCDIFGAVVTRLCKHSSCLFNLILASTRERERDIQTRWDDVISGQPKFTDYVGGAQDTV